MVKVIRSTVINAPTDVVWAVLRDFNSHDRWHAIVRASRIEGGRLSDEVGAVRDFALASGGGIREQLLALSDASYTLTYCILDAPLPLVDYVATIRLKPITDGNRTFWQWECRFDPPPERAAELVGLVGTEVYEGGFDGLRRVLAAGGDPVR
ncbi:MAG: SRPBCC family protein [Sphingomonadales bacterium]|nr:SRPBCC family protein [Sphingomonadales bacterium]